MRNGVHKKPKTKTTAQQIKELRDEQELHYLQRNKSRYLQEDTIDQWLGPYLELIQRETKDWAPIGTLGRQSRKGGKDFPVFRNEIDLRLLRSAARIVTATNIYAIGLMEGLTSYVIGTGFSYKATIKNADAYPGMADGLQKIIDEFLSRNQFGGNDSGELSLAGEDFDEGEQPSFEEEGFKRWRIDGELIALSSYNDDGSTDVRMIEPDQLTQPNGDQKVKLKEATKNTNGGDFNCWGFGVYSDPNDAQRPLAYNVRWDEGLDKIYYPHEVTHMRANSWRTVKRGVTDFSFDVADTFRLATLLRGNIGEGAAQRATIVGVLDNPTGTRSEISGYVDGETDYTTNRFGSDTKSTDRVQRMVAGQWPEMFGGKTFAQGPAAGNDQYHLAVLQGILRAAAVRWNATEWLTSGDSSNNAFASSMTANSQFVLSTKRAQKAPRFCYGKIVIRAVKHKLETMSQQGQPLTCTMPDGAQKTYDPKDVLRVSSITIEVPSPEAVDPYKDAQADDIYLRNHIVDPITIQRQRGFDPDTIQKNWNKWKDENPDFAAPPLQMPFDSETTNGNGTGNGID